MPMERETHESLLNELNNTDLTHERRTEILQELRQDYGTVHTDFENLTTERNRFEEDNTSLIKANSKLFRQLGIQDNPDMKKKEDEKSFSETIRLEDLEK